MTSYLILSNGHGEDLSGSLIGNELKNFGNNVDAIPLVGKGSFYLKHGIKCVGKTREFTTGGLGYTSLWGRLLEIIQGQIFHLIENFIRGLLIARNYDFIVVVGDIVPVLFAWLLRLPTHVYLVAYSSHYEGRLNLPWPLNICLSSHRILSIFTRDKLTAQDLSMQLNRNVVFNGNPFMDEVLVSKKKLPMSYLRLAILPGSRRPELDKNLRLLLKVIHSLNLVEFRGKKVSIDMALVNSIDNYSLQKIVINEGWTHKISSDSNDVFQLIKGTYIINIYRDSFVDILQSSDVVLAMAGTATEQAVGLAKPVVQLPGYGPQFTPDFAEAQRRLLGPTVFCSNRRVNDHLIFLETANLIVNLFYLIKKDDQLTNECFNQANNRLGEKGGVKEIVQSITKYVS